MNTPKIFRVVYQTGYSKGCIRVYVGNFFSNTNLRNIDKLLKLAKANCTEEQRIALLTNLEEAKQEQYEKTKRTRIEKCIQKIKAQTWGKAC